MSYETTTGLPGRALGYFCEQVSSNQECWKARDQDHAELAENPFPGSPDRTSLDAGQGVFLVAFPGHTDKSVRNMALMLAEEAKSHARRTKKIELRIIRIPEGESYGEPKCITHDIYFEFKSMTGTFICGGCNDVSDKGGDGAAYLEAIFGMFAHLLCVQLQTVTLSLNAIDIKRNLETAHNEAMTRKEAA